MKLDGPVRRITVFLGIDGSPDHEPAARRPMAHELVERAYTAGMVGATVLRSMETPGDSAAARANPILDPHRELPQVVTILDSPEKVEEFLSTIEDVVSEGLIIIDDVALDAEVPESPEPASIPGPDTAAPSALITTPDEP